MEGWLSLTLRGAAYLLPLTSDEDSDESIIKKIELDLLNDQR